MMMMMVITMMMMMIMMMIGYDESDYDVEYDAGQVGHEHVRDADHGCGDGDDDGDCVRHYGKHHSTCHRQSCDCVHLLLPLLSMCLVVPPLYVISWSWCTKASARNIKHISTRQTGSLQNRGQSKDQALMKEFWNGRETICP